MNPDVLCPTPRTWAAVTPGDLIAGKGGTAWLVWSITPRWDGRLAVVILHAGQQWPTRGTNDPGVAPGDPVQVYVPMAERDAIALLSAELPVRAERRVA